MSPNRIEQPAINNSRGHVGNVVRRRVNGLRAEFADAAFDEFAVAVDDAAEFPNALVIVANVDVRNNHAAFNDSEAQIFFGEIILVEDISGGVAVVQIIDVRHRYSPS